MKILIFTEGTILMHESAKGHAREEIVQQAMVNDESVVKFNSYIPIGNAAEKIKRWAAQGAKIGYVTSRTKPEEIGQIKSVLKKYDFPDGEFHFRMEGENYKDVVKRVMPDILIEDDCESIGGEKKMIWPNMDELAKAKVKSIIIKEFGGIDHLPADPGLLLNIKAGQM